MKKFLKYFFLMAVLLFTTVCGKQITEEEATKALQNHLIKRYGEEFEVLYIYRYSTGDQTWYQAEIYPAKYNGTPREYDMYYQETAMIDIKKEVFGESIRYVDDLYRLVLINEQANEFYLPKLKEIFGENVLPVFKINMLVLEEKPNFINDYKENLKRNQISKIKGGIYIFGKVQNEDDRERYRKQIYEFIQFMKETGTFEYVDLEIAVIEENIMSDEYQNNTSLKEELKKSASEQEHEKYRQERKNILEKYNFYTYNIDNIQNKISQINKGHIIYSGVDKWNSFNTLLYTKIYSPTCIMSQNLNNEEIKNYDKVSDVKFYVETW